jgi:hypothetical protein
MAEAGWWRPEQGGVSRQVTNLLELPKERYAYDNCQSTLEWDPGSTCNRDPFRASAAR